MTDLISIFLGPLLGGLVGFVTNDLAVRMLFRPREEMYLGRWHIPFTPGLIPRQKERIAVSIGRVVSKQLLDPGTLQEVLLSEEALQRAEEKIRKKTGRLFGSRAEGAMEKAVARKLTKLYKSILEENLESILEMVDVEKIVVEKICSFDAIQMEEMIFGIMKKELNAIVYMGALLGTAMGFISFLL